MKALLMAAGLGTRLRPLTQTTPKPLLPLAGRPVIDHLLEGLVAAGIREISINLHHLGEQLRQHLEASASSDAMLRFTEEPALLETGGTIAAALDWLGDEPFAVINADIFTDFDFARLPTTLGDDLAHLVVTPTPDWREAGDFEVQDGRVVRRGASHVYCSIGVLSPHLLDNHPPAPFSWRDPLFAAVSAGRVGAQEHLGRWHDIGTLAQYESLQADYP